MFRLLVILGAGLGLTLLIGGRDGGQTRFGLQGAYDIVALDTPPAALQVAAPADVEPALAITVSRAAPAPEPAPAAVRTPSLTQISFAPSAASAAGETLASGLTLSPPPVQEEAAPQRAATIPADVFALQPLRIGRVIGSNVNLREQPSAKAAVLDRLARGEEVTVISTNESGWSLVRIEGDGVEGYIASRYLSNDIAGGVLFPSE